MSPVILGSRHGVRLIALAAGLLVGGAHAPAAHAKPKKANRVTCTPSSQPGSQIFLPFGDTAYYKPVQNAGLEHGSAGWTLTGRAAVVSDQEPWNVSGSAGSHALDLPRGSSAVTAPVCVDPSFPYFRFFAKNVNANHAGLKIEVLYYDTKGKVRKETPVNYTSLASGWKVTKQFRIDVFRGHNAATSGPIAFRFQAVGGHSHYVIDDVYVDPWHRA